MACSLGGGCGIRLGRPQRIGSHQLPGAQTGEDFDALSTQVGTQAHGTQGKCFARSNVDGSELAAANYRSGGH
jgi:hypothetical protein